VIHEKDPNYAWCGEAYGEFLEKMAGASRRCFFMGGEGELFAEAPAFSGNVYFTLFGAIGSSTASETDGTHVGDIFLPRDTLEEIFAFRNLLADIGVVADRFYLKGTNDYEFLLRDRARILFNSSSNAEKVKAALSDLITKQRLSVNIPDAPQRLDYVDVRFPNKIYYKKVGEISQ
jgi:hypothetical protein